MLGSYNIEIEIKFKNYSTNDKSFRDYRSVVMVKITVIGRWAYLMVGAVVNNAATAGKANSPKGERARARLKSAALQVMEETGYHKMRITDVTTRRSGVRIVPSLF